MPVALTDETRWASFERQVMPEPNTGCWLWLGAQVKGGYGRIVLGSKGGRLLRRAAHCFAYETVIGPIPAGLELDHRCRNTTCVNPDHLRPMTRRDNILCSTGPAALNAQKAACPRGHAYDERNTRFYRGERLCRACNRDRNRRRRGAA